MCGESCEFSSLTFVDIKPSYYHIYTCQKRGENQMTILCLLCIKMRKKVSSIFPVPRLTTTQFPLTPWGWDALPTPSVAWSHVPHPAQPRACIPICGTAPSGRGSPAALRGAVWGQQQLLWKHVPAPQCPCGQRWNHQMKALLPLWMILSRRSKTPQQAEGKTAEERQRLYILVPLTKGIFPCSLKKRIHIFFLPRVLTTTQLSLHVGPWVWDPSGLWLRNSRKCETCNRYMR